MTMLDLFNFIRTEYGQRGAWISDIASKLNISLQEANHLTYAMGYRRGKAMQPANYQTFSLDSGVRLIQAKLI